MSYILLYFVCFYLSYNMTEPADSSSLKDMMMMMKGKIFF